MFVEMVRQPGSEAQMTREEFFHGMVAGRVMASAAIRSMVFGGFRRCGYSRQRFDSDTERRFALILDRDSTRWLKPSPRDLQIPVGEVEPRSGLARDNWRYERNPRPV